MIVRTVLSFLMIRYLGTSGFITFSDAGFHSFLQTLITIVGGAVLGFIIYAAGLFFEPPSLDPLVMMNGYAQSLSGAIAAALVCWALAGTVSASPGFIHRADFNGLDIHTSWIEDSIDNGKC